MDDLVLLDTDYKRLKKIFDMIKVKTADLDLELKQTSNEYLKFLSNPIGTEKNQTIILINKII